MENLLKIYTLFDYRRMFSFFEVDFYYYITQKRLFQFKKRIFFWCELNYLGEHDVNEFDRIFRLIYLFVTLKVWHPYRAHKTVL
jgi:hypothetical protein